MEIVLLRISLGDAETMAVLPYIALFTSNTVASIIQVLAIRTTAGAVKDPLVILRELCQILLRLLQLGLEVSSGNSALTPFNPLLLGSKSFELCFV
jgi:hypothetical protein